jgi:DUF2075 family protein
MIIYSSTKLAFLEDVDRNRIDQILVANFAGRAGRAVSPSEAASWRNSLPYMANVLRDAEIPTDVGISVECQILPPSGKRIDFIVSGRDASSKDSAIIVELKQWQEAEKTPSDGIVRTRLGGGWVRTTHPSYQAFSYRSLLCSFNEAVYEGGIALGACAYLHNCSASVDLNDLHYEAYLREAPLFLRHDVELLRDYIKKFVVGGDANGVVFQIDRGRVRPSKALADSVAGLLSGNQEFVMIDEQKIVFEEARDLVKRSKSGSKQVLVVEGGPGTGKSVVAVNLLASLTSERSLVHYVSRNSAPREVYAHKLAGFRSRAEIKNLFKNSWAYVDAREDTFDCLVVDEAHRLNEKSGLYGNLGEHQIKEIIRAARCSVFFLDEDQQISLKDVGSKEEIRRWAKHHRADVTEATLPSQFRCNGSNGYIAWLDNALQIRETQNTTLANIDYDFQVFDCPTAMRTAIVEKNSNNSARLLAGYCWSWKSKKSPQAYDITFPESGFEMKWNLTDDGSLWLVTPSSIDQVGCVHTCQGLELEYVGVIIGPDLRVGEDGKLITDASARAKDDKTVRGWRQMAAKNPEDTYQVTDRIIKNTYRVLMSRGMKGCYVYTTDSLLREHFKRTCVR